MDLLALKSPQTSWQSQWTCKKLLDMRRLNTLQRVKWIFVLSALVPSLWQSFIDFLDWFDPFPPYHFLTSWLSCPTHSVC